MKSETNTLPLTLDGIRYAIKDLPPSSALKGQKPYFKLLCVRIKISEANRPLTILGIPISLLTWDNEYVLRCKSFNKMTYVLCIIKFRLLRKKNRSYSPLCCSTENLLGLCYLLVNIVLSIDPLSLYLGFLALQGWTKLHK